MICLDKPAETAFKHLAYNQSPPALSADHTTCQDLNGISNLREHVKAGQDGSGGGGGGLYQGAASEDLQCHGHQHPSPDPASPGAGRWSKGLSSPPETASGGDDLVRLSQAPTSGRASRLWGWVSWLLSVLVAATLLSCITSRPGASPFHDQHAPISAHVSDVTPLLEPTRIHRRSTCESGGVATEDYDMPLHGSAILIIWFVSTSACGFPILANRVPGLRIPGRFFFIVRHFGTGVLIATAFVHLLPTAFLSLGDPCLGSFWTTDYPAMPGAIALAAIFFVTVIEMIFHPGRHCTSGSQVKSENDIDPESVTSPAPASPVTKTDMGRPIHGRTTSIGRGLAQIETRQMGAEIDANRNGVLEEPKNDVPTSSSETSSEHELSEEQKRRKQRLQVVMLEMGILFHSVFIGMALSVSTGSQFIILLIAIIFHQMFEGLALGSRVAAVDWADKKTQPWLMALAYGFTTPIGQALGLATHTLYSPNSETGLLVVGIMNAISAGLLTFASLVELLSEDFLSDESWRYLRGNRRICACLLVFAGAFLMSLVGAWA
ncbi:ZIP zinc transporter-domain-containing protein [Stachybotrys elegans]|uniref:ZIP zinc transporter-domain-containing protein n=1 Tax=Stachybotrys elegans TaxID=80388 RepID=A0A8K0WP01_9HYPO|nr:ZIP zinc transporter-domain-containing protein [Stachybotrys elegans]